MKYLSVLFILFFLNINAQVKTISVEYKVTVLNEDKLFDNNSALKQLLNNAILNAKYLSFKLIVKNGNSKFFNIPISNPGINVNESAIFPFISYSEDVFTFKDSILYKSSALGKNIYIKKNVVNNWNITN